MKINEEEKTPNTGDRQEELRVNCPSNVECRDLYEPVERQMLKHGHSALYYLQWETPPNMPEMLGGYLVQKH